MFSFRLLSITYRMIGLKKTFEATAWTHLLHLWHKDERLHRTTSIVTSMRMKVNKAVSTILVGPKLVKMSAEPSLSFPTFASVLLLLEP